MFDYEDIEKNAARLNKIMFGSDDDDNDEDEEKDSEE